MSFSPQAAAKIDRQHAWLLAAARNPADMATQAFSGVMSRFVLQGMDTDNLQRLVQSHFPGLQADYGELDLSPLEPTANAALSLEEYADLHRLLHEHRRDDSEENHWVIHAMVSACAGDNHLWQDMGLPNREMLSQLIRRYFPVLFYKNQSNMKWKKFFYKQLCNRTATSLCKAPSCGVCCDYELCFGPEK